METTALIQHLWSLHAGLGQLRTGLSERRIDQAAIDHIHGLLSTSFITDPRVDDLVADITDMEEFNEEDIGGAFRGGEDDASALMRQIEERLAMLNERPEEMPDLPPSIH